MIIFMTKRKLMQFVEEQVADRFKKLERNDRRIEANSLDRFKYLKDETGITARKEAARAEKLKMKETENGETRTEAKTSST